MLVGHKLMLQQILDLALFLTHCRFFVDIILPYLNSTVHSPIASRCPSSRQNSGTGDVDINDILDDVSQFGVYNCYD